LLHLRLLIKEVKSKTYLFTTAYFCLPHACLFTTHPLVVLVAGICCARHADHSNWKNLCLFQKEKEETQEKKEEEEKVGFLP
jgi:hypothetical protein